MSSAPTADTPRNTYESHLAARQETAKQFEEKMDRLGMGRVAVFVVGVAVAWFAFGAGAISGWWLLVPIAMFLFLLYRFDVLRRARRRAERAVRWYQLGLDRLNDEWQGKGHGGSRFLDDDHLYALDLDVFGDGSLFERLCSTRTEPGETALAKWLRAPATPEEIAGRQTAVRELTPRLDLREELALLGAEVPPVHFSALDKWGQSPAILSSDIWRYAVMIMAAVNVATVISATFLSWIEYRISVILVVASFAVSSVLVLWLRNRVEQVLKPVEPMGRDLFLLAGILRRLEQESFSAPLLAKMHQELRVEGRSPSEQIGHLAFRIDWLNAMKNQFFIPIGLLLMWRTQMAFAIELWRKKSGAAVSRWLNAIGVMEALSSLSGYAFENPEDPFPEVVEGSPHIDGAKLGHPLLPKSECIHNDVKISSPTRALIVSGSNMSGKSTLLRTVGVNTVLALAGAPVRAERLTLTPLAIGATLRIQDSLLKGRSRFAAEIDRIRAILDASNNDMPVLFLLDELFHGTNSHDRGIGAGALVRRLLKRDGVGLLTTHDLTITAIADQLDEQVKNVHFADQFVDGKMHFDYTMRPGVVPHSNALALMRAIGLEV